MFGIIIGSALAFGACAFMRHHRHHSRCGAFHGRGCHHHHPRGGHGRRRRGWQRPFGAGPGRFAAFLADRVEATPEQEEIIYDSLRGLMRELRELKDELRPGGRDLGEAFAGERLDEERLGELFARHDELLGGARKAVVGALARIHDALEPRQRESLARWLGRRGSFDPYRM